MEFREENVQVKETAKAITKAALNRIAINELPERLPNFKGQTKTKDNVLAEWLTAWIDAGLTQGKLKINDLLPTKNEISEKTGVSIGTVQSAIRIIEDSGYVASKQRIGTFICERNADGIVRKQVSKRDNTVEVLKKFIVNGGYQVGEPLPSSRNLSKLIGSAPNTTRLALECLVKDGTIQSQASRGNKASWILNMMPDKEDINDCSIDADSLVNQVERDLKNLITENYKAGDKLMSHYELSDTLKVSIKTVHDAIKRLVTQGILQSKRGRYGTYILRMPSDKQVMTGIESEIFAPAVQASMYNYERVENYLKEHITSNFKAGDKLPSMSQFATELNVSSNTVRKALQQLADEGYVRFSRGRYGGTFLVKVPEAPAKEEKVALSWLAVNTQQAGIYSKKS